MVDDGCHAAGPGAEDGGLCAAQVGVETRLYSVRYYHSVCDDVLTYPSRPFHGNGR